MAVTLAQVEAASWDISIMSCYQVEFFMGQLKRLVARCMRDATCIQDEVQEMLVEACTL